MNISATQQDSPLVLIADDDKFTRLQIRQRLQKEGYRVEEVSNGEQCLAAYTRLEPDIVLLDGMMPVMDGFTCCGQLRLLPGGEHIPILMITGLDDEASVNWAFEAGATDYINKPIHWAVLRQRVRRLLREAQLLRKLEQANQDLQRLASEDSLTQLANRRHFDAYLSQEWKRMARDETPLSLIMGDIDFFKAYNDTFGHQAGDYCLQQIAKAISLAAKRPADLVARYGGEEFVVILPNTDSEGALQVVNEMRINIRALEISHPTQVSQYVTLSFGVASAIPTQETLPEMLITKADKVLYQAKAEGHNRVALAQT